MFPIFSGKNIIILIPFEWLEETTLGRGVINMKGIFAPVSVKNMPKVNGLQVMPRYTYLKQSHRKSHYHHIKHISIPHKIIIIIIQLFYLQKINKYILTTHLTD